MEKVHENYKITGMSCAACAKAVERIVKKLDGVEDQNVNIATEKLSITYDKSKISFNDIKLAIEKGGYGVENNIENKNIDLKIEGMSCAACAKAIESVVKKLDGVELINVNIATDKASINYNPSKIKLSEIKRVIEKAGYNPVDENNNILVDKDKIKKEKEIKTLFTKFIIAMAFSIPLFYIAMGPMVPSPIGPWPLPEIINPTSNTLNYALIQLILVVPIMCVGYKFYINGYKSLISLSPNMDTLVAIGTSSAFLYSVYTSIL